jgi:hypothetical protein
VDVKRWQAMGAYGAAVVLLALGGWSLTATAAQPGTVHVGQVHAAAPPKHGMPGMGSDNDPVAEGKRRVTVDVTLVAADAALDYAVDRFSLTVGDDRIQPHRAILPGRSVPAGAQLSGSLVFDVPDSARHGVLALAGRDGSTVDLPAADQ